MSEPFPLCKTCNICMDRLIYFYLRPCMWLFAIFMYPQPFNRYNCEWKKQTNTQTCFLTKVVYQSVQMTVMIGRWHHKNTHITKFSTNNYLELCCQRQQTEKQLLNKFMLLRALLKMKKKTTKSYVACTKMSEYMAKKTIFLARMV